MRKYLLGLFAVIAAVSLSAFTSAKTSEKAVKSAPLYWFEYDMASGAGAYLDYGERIEFVTSFCNDVNGIDCRRGYTLTDLVNQNDPEQGVIDDDSHDDRIRKE
jgi:hypothetical protein